MLAPIDALALGVAAGATMSVMLIIITVVPVLSGNREVSAFLNLIGQYFPGYSVSLIGSIAGGFYGLLTGFVAGWVIGALHNTFMKLFVAIAAFKARLETSEDFFDAAGPRDGVQ